MEPTSPSISSIGLQQLRQHSAPQSQRLTTRLVSFNTMSAMKSKYTANDIAVMTCVKREFFIYALERNELRTLRTGYLSVHFGLAGIMFGAFLALFITWVSVPLSQSTKSVFLVLSVLSLVLTLYCAAMAVADYRKSKAVLDEIQSTTASVIMKQE